MATLVGKQSELTDMLKALLELDYDAIAAYDVAINKLENSEYKLAFQRFRADHERHTVDLTTSIRGLGAEPPEGKDMKSVLTRGKVFMGNLAGDKGILIAMRSNEKDTNIAYERAALRDGLSPSLRSLLEANWEDEQRHRRWIEEHLVAMGVKEDDDVIFPEDKDKGIASEEFIRPR